MSGHARAAATNAARDSRARLLALLAVKTGNVIASEDALADAFEASLLKWPKDGVPTNPEAWLLTVALNRARDRFRSAAYKSNAPMEAAEAVAMDTVDPTDIPDERLKMMFVCAHPAIDVAIRTPLMLQCVLSLDAARIARAFLLPASALAQRLVRAKRKIAAARIPFATPSRGDMPSRMGAVLEAIYGAYAITWEGSDEDITTEALYLADLLVELMPEEPEALGLAALLSFSHARVKARNAVGYVPLSIQDTSVWCLQAIDKASNLLRRANRHKCVGRFQLEAAIQAVHCDRARSGITDWPAIVALYEGLVAIAPSTGAYVARAAAVGQVHGPEAGLTALSAAKEGEMHQPYWATRAALLKSAGRDADAAFAKAISLSSDPRVQSFLRQSASQKPRL